MALRTSRVRPEFAYYSIQILEPWRKGEKSLIITYPKKIFYAIKYLLKLVLILTLALEQQRLNNRRKSKGAVLGVLCILIHLIFKMTLTGVGEQSHETGTDTTHIVQKGKLGHREVN